MLPHLYFVYWSILMERPIIKHASRDILSFWSLSCDKKQRLFREPVEEKAGQREWIISFVLPALVTWPALKGHICSLCRLCVNPVAAVPAGTWLRAVDLWPRADSWGRRREKRGTNGNPKNKKSLRGGGEGDTVSPPADTVTLHRAWWLSTKREETTDTDI